VPIQKNFPSSSTTHFFDRIEYGSVSVSNCQMRESLVNVMRTKESSDQNRPAGDCAAAHRSAVDELRCADVGRVREVRHRPSPTRRVAEVVRVAVADHPVLAVHDEERLQHADTAARS
jgi:hypothetical protein